MPSLLSVTLEDVGVVELEEHIYEDVDDKDDSLLIFALDVVAVVPFFGDSVFNTYLFEFIYANTSEA